MKTIVIAAVLGLAACGGPAEDNAPQCVADGTHAFTATASAPGSNVNNACSALPATFAVVGSLAGQQWDVTENGLHYLGSVGTTCPQISMFTDATGFIHATEFGANPPRLYVFQPNGGCTAEYFLRGD